MTRRHGMAVCMTLGIALGGCASTSPVAVESPREVQPPLVISPISDRALAAAYADEGGWERDRNDGSLGVGGSLGLQQFREVEIRNTDYRWTQNGRVNETSRTTTRTRLRGIQITR